MMKFKTYFSHLAVLCLGFLAFFVQGPEFVSHLSDHAFDNGDSFLNAWILAWDSYALFKPGVSVWDAPIFYPVKNALAFSENMLGNLWITLPIQYLTGNPIFAANVLALVSFILCLYCTFILVFDLTKSYWAGVFAGILFSCNPYRWGHLAHLQLLPFFWAPLALLFANRFLQESRPRYFFVMLAIVWIQYYCSIYLGTMLLTLLLVLFLIHIFAEQNGRDRWAYVLVNSRLFALGLISSALVLLPLGVPYLSVARQWEFFRTIDENILYSGSLLGFLSPNFFFSNYEWLRRVLADTANSENAVFAGLIPLSGFMLMFLFRSRWKDHFRESEKRVVYRFGLLGVVMALLMMGPYLVLFDKNTGIPLPFLLVHKLVPGGQAIRVPARFFLPFLLCLSVVCGFGIAFLLKRLPAWKQRAIFLVFAGALISFDYKLPDWTGVATKPASQFPAVYSYLAQTNPGKPVLELPAMSEYRKLIYQTLHWKPILGGTSGWAPPSYEFLARQTDDCPSESCLRILQAIPVQTVVVHLNELFGNQKKLWKEADLAPFGFLGPNRLGDDLVWEKNAVSTMSPMLKASRFYLAQGKHGAIILFKPSQKGTAFGFQGGRKTTIEFHMRTSDNREFRVSREMDLPVYVKSGGIVQTIIAVPEKPAVLTGISGDFIERYELNPSSTVALNSENSSLPAAKPFEAKIAVTSGFSENLPMTGMKAPFGIDVQNTGKLFWLDTAGRQLFGSKSGGVFLVFRWHDEPNPAPCKTPRSTFFAEEANPMDHITGPGELAEFRGGIGIPNRNGTLILRIGVGVEREGKAMQLDDSSAICFDVSITQDIKIPEDFSRFFINPQTRESRNRIEALKRLPRENQIKAIMDRAKSIRELGGPTVFGTVDIHLREKALELAETLAQQANDPYGPTWTVRKLD